MQVVVAVNPQFLPPEGGLSDRRVLVWMVASASGIQAFFQAGDAFLAASVSRTALWLLAMVVMFLLAFFIESYKGAAGR